MEFFLKKLTVDCGKIFHCGFRLMYVFQRVPIQFGLTGTGVMFLLNTTQTLSQN